jgi:hypothetical protein
MNQNANVNKSPLLESEDVSTDEYERTLQIRIEENKERYYQSILDNIYIDPNAPEKKVCKVCKKDFHFISNKAQLMKLLDEIVDETKPFALEMVRFRENCYIQGEDSKSFVEDKNECGHCYLYKDRKRESKKGSSSSSWVSKMGKSIFGKKK